MKRAHVWKVAVLAAAVAMFTMGLSYRYHCFACDNIGGFVKCNGRCIWSFFSECNCNDDEIKPPEFGDTVVEAAI